MRKKYEIIIKNTKRELYIVKKKEKIYLTSS